MTRPNYLSIFRKAVLPIFLLAMVATLALGQMNEDQKLLALDGAAYDQFGCPVSISGDVTLIGAHEDDDNGTNSGSAYVYRYDAYSGNWLEEAKLLPSDGAAEDWFGASVFVSSDIAIIGAFWDDDNGTDSGSAYVFRYDAGSGTWAEEAKLLPSDGAADDWFGVCVSISADVAVFGAYGDDDNGSNSGSAYVFQYDTGSGTWAEEVKLLPSDGNVDALFGYAVSVYGDIAMVGARRDDDNGTWSGSAYFFDLIKDPLLDIECNGEDQNVIVTKGDNVVLTIDIAARDFAGTAVDIWVLISRNAGGVYSYGYYGAPNWGVGMNNVYFTGGLFDDAATILDMAVPVGMYSAWLVLEDDPDGGFDYANLWDYDMVSFIVVP